MSFPSYRVVDLCDGAESRDSRRFKLLVGQRFCARESEATMTRVKTPRGVPELKIAASNPEIALERRRWTRAHHHVHPRYKVTIPALRGYYTPPYQDRRARG
ncbi:MAG TPA: hypothetical protein VHN14_25400 [Kofleriaceae bacterium]|jgi:hypothetical protein|nr:hypothetical protein [Kofleriaceae bacterium]